MTKGEHMHRMAWLVDIGYLARASADHFRLDYVAAERLLEEAFGPAQTFLFNGYDSLYGIPEGLQAFYDAMQRHGMVLQLHPMQPGPPGANRQRRVDVDFGAHLVWQASLPHVQTLVVTTGDQDFIPAVEVVKTRLDKRVILFTYNSCVSEDLAAVVDRWWRFKQDRTRLEWA